MMRRLALSLTLLLLACSALADSFPFDAEHWSVDGKESRFERYRGRASIFLKEARATLKGVTMRDGVVEFDVAFPLERGFNGLAFRMAAAEDYEEFYLRQHLSEMPDANQYSPVFHRDSGWQIYTGPRYCVPAKYSDNEWMHVRVSFSGSRGEAEVAGQVIPIPELKRDPVDGGLALYANIAGARFANFEIHPGPVAIAAAALPPESKPAGVAETFLVSQPFDAKTLNGQTQIPGDLTKTLHWTPLKVEANGIANLSRLAAVKPGQDTVFARLTIHADRAVTREVRFGFSDRVKVYLNGQLLYSGDDTYVSRDYRFLGSVGLFDSVALPLRKGDNELWFAVSESFGGWAVIAELPHI